MALVSNHTSPLSTAYHMATKCGCPSAPTVAMVVVRELLMNSVISSSDMTICERWLLPIFGA
ncbi:Uncharacterised protein [Mycobacteroides abscessus subsp. abscessus]|nr:Uncharacterised protein [Mycobacteroides abscessus subsp. abscessus]